jgi:hypothetical protein
MAGSERGEELAINSPSKPNGFETFSRAAKCGKLDEERF